MNIIDEYGALRNALFKLSSKYWRLQKEMSEEESADHFENGIALIKAKKDLYQYLKENLDDK